MKSSATKIETNLREIVARDGIFGLSLHANTEELAWLWERAMGTEGAGDGEKLEPGVRASGLGANATPPQPPVQLTDDDLSVIYGLAAGTFNDVSTLIKEIRRLRASGMQDRKLLTETANAAIAREVAAEREACAKAVEEEDGCQYQGGKYTGCGEAEYACHRKMAERIRARGNA